MDLQSHKTCLKIAWNFQDLQKKVDIVHQSNNGMCVFCRIWLLDSSSRYVAKKFWKYMDLLV